jgi:hypothetical protein
MAEWIVRVSADFGSHDVKVDGKQPERSIERADEIARVGFWVGRTLYPSHRIISIDIIDPEQEGDW